MNAKKFASIAAAAALAGCCTQCKEDKCREDRYPGSIDEGFVSIFNGYDLEGWRGATEMYGVDVKNEPGVLKCFPDRKLPEGRRGDIWTAKEYGNFVLRFEFALPENGDSGLGLRYDDNGGKGSDGEVKIGFYAFHSHRIIDCDDCALQPRAFALVVEITREFITLTNADIYDEATGRGRLRHIYIRLGEVTSELMVCFVVNGNGLKREDLLIKMLRDRLPNLKTVVFNSNREKTNVILGSKNRVAYGDGFITDELCGLKFKISPFSFWQVNRRQAEKLYNKVKEYAGLSGGEALLDLYCGTGTIGLTMAKDCKTLIGVEIIEDAVRDAEQNAALNKIENARFICADAPEAAQKLKKEGVSPNVVVLDPPRKGCGEELVNTVAEMSPDRVVYVSCDPATLARDLKFFAERGYRAVEVTPCDMFSRTAHVESVVKLARL